MDELTRFARVLVERLGRRAEGAQGPVSVAAIRLEVLPYQDERRALGLSSVEDYESVLLRLVAEERGLVRTTPSAAAERCRDVLAQPNPDLGVLDEVADSIIQVTSLAAGQTMAQEEPRAEPPPVSNRDSCSHCRELLPVRPAVFCPWCGRRLVPLRCRRCGTEFESGWRHCITCGAPVGDPYPSAGRS